MSSGPVQRPYNPSETFDRVTAGQPMQQWERQLWFALIYIPALVVGYLTMDKLTTQPAAQTPNGIVAELELQIEELKEGNETLAKVNEGLGKTLEGSTAALEKANARVRQLEAQLPVGVPNIPGSGRGDKGNTETLKGKAANMAKQPFHFENLQRNAHYEIEIDSSTGLLCKVHGYFGGIIRDGRRIRALFSKKPDGRGNVVACPLPVELAAAKPCPPKTRT